MGRGQYFRTEETRAKMRAVNPGRHRNEESRAKNRVAHLGRHASEETRAKCSAAKMGHPVSAETRAKIGAANLGHPVSAETLSKITAIQPGDKSPNWKGGRSINSRGYMQVYVGRKSYREEHRVIMEKILCRKLQKSETVHHANKKRFDNRDENLALCSNFGAHRWSHSEEAKVFFG